MNLSSIAPKVATQEMPKKYISEATRLLGENLRLIKSLVGATLFISFDW